MLIQSLRYLYNQGVWHVEAKISVSNLGAVNMRSSFITAAQLLHRHVLDR
jgi:hypothetical protein